MARLIIPEWLSELTPKEQSEWLDKELKEAEKYAEKLRKMKCISVYLESKTVSLKFTSEDRSDLAKMK